MRRTGQGTVAALPQYASGFKPAEVIRAYLKKREMANQCAKSTAQFSGSAREYLNSVQRRPALVRAY